MKQEKQNRLNEKFCMDLITAQDCKKLIAAADSDCDKAIISIFYETGCDLLALSRLELRDITRKDNYIVIRFSGYWDTIDHTFHNDRYFIPIYTSRCYLLKWLDKYPNDRDVDSSLWLKCNKDNSKLTQLEYGYIKKLLRKTFAKANIKKRHTPYWFQYSSISNIATEFRGEILYHFMEWRLSHDLRNKKSIFDYHYFFIPDFVE